MAAQEFVGTRLSKDEWTVNLGDLRPHQRAIFEELKEAARIGGDLYAEQAVRMASLREPLQELKQKDPLANDLLTIPDDDQRFVSFWNHSAMQPHLYRAQSIILSAANKALQAGDTELGNYLRIAGGELTTGDYLKIALAYIPLSSKINFHLLPFETIGGKKVWQGYLGIQDTEETRKINQSISDLKVAAAKRGEVGWYNKATTMSVDNVGVISGYAATEAQNALRRRAGLPGKRTGFSAQNLPNEINDVGTRINIYRAAFEDVFNEEIKRIAERYLKHGFLPTLRGTSKFLGGHELYHNLRYPNFLGEFHNVLRESLANQGSIDLGGEAWNPEATDDMPRFSSYLRGGLGYALRDCDPFLRGAQPIPDLGTLAAKDIYIPGNLIWLNIGVYEKVFQLRDGMIAGIDFSRAWRLSSRLAAEERFLLEKGTEQDVRNHFEELLPNRPIFNDHNINAKVA